MSEHADDLAVDDVRVGQVCRAIRRRRGWRQSDLGDRARCSQSTVSRLERGQLEAIDLGTIRRIFRALEASFEGMVRWRAGDLDRLLDERHAALVESVASRLRAWGWSVHPEVTFAIWGERGSIDLLAVRLDVRAAGVFEMKTDVPRVEEAIRRHDDKARLASTIVRERFGFAPVSIGRVLVFPEDRSLRRLLDHHESTFQAAYPSSSRAVRAWLRQPTGPLAGIWFLTGSHPRTGSRSLMGRHRVRVAHQDRGRA